MFLKKFCKKRFFNGQNTASFCLFASICQYNDKYSLKFDYGISVDDVFGIWTRDRKLVGTDESTELMAPQKNFSQI